MNTVLFVKNRKKIWQSNEFANMPFTVFFNSMISLARKKPTGNQNLENEKHYFCFYIAFILQSYCTLNNISRFDKILQKYQKCYIDTFSK